MKELEYAANTRLQKYMVNEIFKMNLQASEIQKVIKTQLMVPVTHLGPGCCFGELALQKGATTRQGTAVTLEEC
jgi:hypothetical protein